MRQRRHHRIRVPRPGHGWLALLAVVAFPLVANAQGPEVTFGSVGEWNQRLAQHTATLKSRSPIKLFLTYFYPLAGPTKGVLPPFSEAEPAAQEAFLRRYVSTGLESVRRPVNPTKKLEYLSSSTWVGLEYVRRFREKWWDVPELRRNWPVLLRSLLETYEEEVLVLTDPGEKIERVEELLSAYSELDCVTGRHTPNDTQFVIRWKQFVEEYARLYAVPGAAAGRTAPEVFRAQANLCAARHLPTG